MIANVELRFVDPDGGSETSPTLNLRASKVWHWRIIERKPLASAAGHLRVFRRMCLIANCIRLRLSDGMKIAE